MAMQSPYRVVLTDADRRELTARARSQRAAYREVLRARIVLAAGDGTTNAAIARRLGVCVDTVRKWRARVCAPGLPRLADPPPPGRRRGFSATPPAAGEGPACAPPAGAGAALARWGC